MKRRIALALAVIALVWASLASPLRASALVLPDGRTKTCVDAAGATVPETISESLPYAAYTSWSKGIAGERIALNPAILERSLADSDRLVATLTAQGVPNPGAARARQIVMESLAYHECYHAHYRNSNEVDANCDMVLQLRALGEFSQSDLDYLGRYHQNLGTLSAQYLGSGTAFWAATMRCVERERASEPVPIWENLPTKN